MLAQHLFITSPVLGQNPMMHISGDSPSLIYLFWIYFRSCCSVLGCTPLSICAQVKDQARRLTQLEETLVEMKLRPMARRRCMEAEEDAFGCLERTVSKLTLELEVTHSLRSTFSLNNGE